MHSTVVLGANHGTESPGNIVLRILTRLPPLGGGFARELLVVPRISDENAVLGVSQVLSIVA